MKKIALLGSTGSIGKQVLRIVDRYPEKYSIVALACDKNAEELQRQIVKYKPLVAGLSNPENAYKITELSQKTTLYTGENALMHCIIEDADVVFVAVVGFCGFSCVMQAVSMGKQVALANKESLVAGGSLIMPFAKDKGVDIIPVDSEHSAIWQSLRFNKDNPFKKIIITASGGALKDVPIKQLPFVTPETALKHPNWNMGAKITVDCATMVNKGLEVMEAMHLFNCPLDKIEVLIHPQSIIHSMVEYTDNAVIAQLGTPSMDIPIQLALSYPERFKTDAKPLTFDAPLTFEKVDLKRYPCFSLAMQCAKSGGIYPCVLSGANEVAVNLFLQGKIPYTHIYNYIYSAIEKQSSLSVTYENLIFADRLARQTVLTAFKEKKFD